MTKLDELINWFNGKDRVLVALSGGVDSALVAYAAFQNLGNSAKLLLLITKLFRGMN